MVEIGYYAMLIGGGLQKLFESDEALVKNELGWFADRLATVAAGYAALITERDAAFLDSALQVPWFDFPLTRTMGCSRW